MNIQNKFNRLSGYFSDGMEKVQTATSDLGDSVLHRASDVTGRARTALSQGTSSLISAEETLLAHMRKAPTIYIVTGLLLVGAIVLKTMLLSERPMLRRSQP